MRGLALVERDGTRAETRFPLSPKRTSPFKSMGASFQSTAGSRGVRISLSNAGYTMFGGGVRVLATHSIHQFPLHFPSRASPCATSFRTSSTTWAAPSSSAGIGTRLLLGQSGFRFSVGAVDRSLLPNVETGSVVHPASLFNNTSGVVSSGVNRLEREVELSPLCSAGVSDKWRYTSPRPLYLYSIYIFAV